MPISEDYQAQVRLLVQAFPTVAEEGAFALKGGTAINLFIRDLPRLSVDIDLAYLPVEDRKTSITNIEAALKRIKGKLERSLGVIVSEARVGQERILTKLQVIKGKATVKIEVTPVLRGSVFPAETRQVQTNVEANYGFAEMQIVSFADLYGGKIVAALDRQHPRDLFDVRDLMANEGMDQNLRAAFAIYLISHTRPMAELLTVRPKDIEQEFERGFAGMTDEDVSLDDLLTARDAIKALAVDQMPQHHRQLLLSVEQGKPDWSLLEQDNLSADVGNLPAIQWRLSNINGLDETKRAANVEELARVLEL